MTVFCVTTSQTDFCPKSPNSWFTVINDKEKENILTFMKLEAEDVWHFCLKTDWNYELIVIVALFYRLMISPTSFCGAGIRKYDRCGSGVELAPCYRKVNGLIPLVCVSNCSWRLVGTLHVVPSALTYQDSCQPVVNKCQWASTPSVLHYWN